MSEEATETVGLLSDAQDWLVIGVSSGIAQEFSDIAQEFRHLIFSLSSFWALSKRLYAMVFPFEHYLSDSKRWMILILI